MFQSMSNRRPASFAMSKLQAELQKRRSTAPDLIAGHGDIGVAVAAVKAGAHDFWRGRSRPSV
jgi:FixJ family two-component response regulator